MSLTGKLTWSPWELGLGRRWLVRPASAALQLTYTFGRQFFLTLPDRYEPGYYDFETALRAGIAFGGLVARRGGGRIAEIGAYFELVALDLMIFNWIHNEGALGPQDVFTLALGIRLAW